VDAIEDDAYGQVLEWWHRNETTMKHHDSPLMRTLETGQSFHRQVVSIDCLDGRPKSLLESTSPLRALDGAIVGAVMILQDLTERRKVEADFEERITHLVAIGVELESGSHERRQDGS
ncbi:MAG: PAS domain-containing protein, partial [Polyangiaceae bacterium]